MYTSTRVNPLTKNKPLPRLFIGQTNGSPFEQPKTLISKVYKKSDIRVFVRPLKAFSFLCRRLSLSHSRDATLYQPWPPSQKLTLRCSNSSPTRSSFSTAGPMTTLRSQISV
ncbi:PREDICTED: uncharacterized protein LOC109130785 [Camelina sativa]|uniref:Uncharacterized protein LOC109130785 n=1 Tax=Camelina sativa TaxID=90675 RepID=A0ABM1RBH5_CAMSA|nr:PREDICTED: uncharacterized protein LOC109130785 [Camelina sativa]